MLGRFGCCPECGADALEEDLLEGLVPYARCMACGFESSPIDGRDDDGILHVVG